MEIKAHCTYCDNKFKDYVYSTIEAKNIRCPKCRSGIKDLKVRLTDGKSFCKDCGDETKPGPGSARCERCWEDRFGVVY